MMTLIQQNREGLADAFWDEIRFVERRSHEDKGSLPNEWNDSANWCSLYDIPEGRPFSFMTSGSNFLFVDGDHTIDPDSGQMTPWVRDVLERIWRVCSTYYEQSISGTGFHLICDLGVYAEDFEKETNGNNKIIVDMNPDQYVKLPKEERDKTAKIEIFYKTGQPIILTGHHQKLIQVARDEEAAALFSELLQIRQEFHEKYGFSAGASNDSSAPIVSIDEDTRRLVHQALPFISAFDRETWIRVGIALHNCGFDFEVWDRWSQYTDQREGVLCDKYDRRESERQWKSFARTRSRWNAGTIIRLANEAGFPGAKTQTDLIRNRDGSVKSSFGNALAIIRADEMLRGRFRFNQLSGWHEFENLTFYTSKTNIVNDACLRAVREYIVSKYSMDGKVHIEDAIFRECETHPYDPAVDFFNSLIGTWDGEDRLASYLPRYLGVEQSAYTTSVLTHTLYGLLHRVFEPGCKFDECLVLVGPQQGTGKSTLARMFAVNDDWFWACKKLPGDLNRFYDNLQGCLVVELEEMAACRGVEVEVLRGILSERIDVFDRKYQRPDRYPRRCIFIGTTNSLDALPRDPAGNRRFLPVLCRPQFATARPYSEEGQRQETLQLLAQGMELYVAGKLPSSLPLEITRIAGEMREAFTPQDENQASLDQWIWECWDASTVEGRKAQRFTMLDAYNRVFNISGLPVKSLSRKDQRQMAEYLDHCPMIQRYSGSTTHKTRVYGRVVLAWEFRPEFVQREGLGACFHSSEHGNTSETSAETGEVMKSQGF